MDTGSFKTKEGRLEERLRSTESDQRITSVMVTAHRTATDLPLVADSDNLTVGELVALLQGRRVRGSLELLLEIEGDVAELLLDVTDDFTLSSGVEGITALHQVLDEELGEVTAGKIDTENRVGERETLVNGHGVGDTVTGVENDTRGTTGGVEGKYGLDSNVERGGIERLEHDLGHLFTVGLGVEGGFGEKDGVLLGGDTELVVEGVVPDLLHVVPVGDDTVLDGVFEREDTTLGLSLVAVGGAD